MKHAKLPALLLTGLLLLSSCALPAVPAPGETAPAASSPSAPAEGATLPLDPFRLDERYTRYYPETTHALIPRDDYGPIYPYIAAAPANAFAYNGFLYGFCDAVGRIICDPYFSDVTLYEHEGVQVYLYRKAVGHHDPQNAPEADESTMFLAAVDGHFVLEFDEIQDGGEGTLAVKQGGKWGSVDYTGRQVLPCAYETGMVFSEGLAAVTKDFSSEYHYVNRTGETVIGPLPPISQAVREQESAESYQYQMPFHIVTFHEGRARFFQGNMYGFLDQTGAIVIPARYHFVRWNGEFRNGRAIVSVDDLNRHALIDAHGNDVIPPGEWDIGLVWSGTAASDVYLMYDRTRYKQWYMDRDGTLILDATPDGSDKRYNYLGDGWFDEYEGDSHALWRDGVSYPIGTLNDIFFLGGDRFLIGYRVDERYAQKIIDSAGTVYFQTEEGMWLDYRYGERQTLCAHGRYGIIDRNGTELIPPLYHRILPLGDHYLVWQGIYGGLLDPAGDWVIKVSLLDSMGD